jgi:hypothetical protein
MTGKPRGSEYPVFFRDSDARIFWKLETRGIMVAERGLSFQVAEGPREIAFPEIASIRLQTAFAMYGAPVIGMCAIERRDGRVLTVYSGDALGRGDDQQRAHYEAFVRALHRAIPAQEKSRIAFRGGLSDTRHAVVSAAMIVGALLFVALPLGLLVIIPSWEVLGLAGTGAGFAFAGRRSGE